jgi:hypothetical protein
MDQSESTAANLDRRSRRRWFQYSLRSFLILVTGLAVWLGVVAHRARQQREAAKAIEALRGHVVYDWQLQHTPNGAIIDIQLNGKPSGPTWLRRLTGDEVFQEPEIVTFMVNPPLSDEEYLQAIPTLQQLRRLKQVDMWKPVAQETVSKLQSALPNCEVRSHQKR